MYAFIPRLVGAVLVPALLAGCSVGSMFGGSDDASYANVTASQAQVTAAANSAIPAIATQCPPIRIRAGAEYYRSYAGNRSSDPSALRFQGVLDRASRNCVSSNGAITIDMGVVGRVIVGPSGSDGTVAVPLRFAIQRDGLAVFSERYDISVNASSASANEFSYTVEDVAIPYVGGETITIFVGFDN